MNRKICTFFVLLLILTLLSMTTSRTAGNPQPLVSWPAAVPAPACDCSHLEALRTELRNALSLQQAFRNEIPVLQKMPAGSAQGEYQRFTQDVARGIKRPAGDTGPGAVDYIASGEIKYSTENLARHTTEELCQPSDNTKRDLESVDRGAICAASAAAVRAHEDVHQKMCRSVGYPAYRDMHPADRAAEEVEAYGAQIEVLRAEIARLEGKNGIEIEGKTATPDLGPVGTFTFETKGNSSLDIDANDKITGTGKFTVTIKSSACRLSWNEHTGDFSLSGRASRDTLTLNFIGLLAPSNRVTCPDGGGSSIPVNITMEEFKIPRKDGAQYVIDYGPTVTGRATITLHLCSEEKK